MTLTDLTALALAARAVLDLWLDEDSILIGLRARTQEYESWFWATLWNCRLCLSVWAPPLVIGGWVASLFVPAPWGELCKTPMYCLAVTGAVGLMDRAFGAPSGRPPGDTDVRPD